MKNIVIDDVLARLSLKKTPLWQFLARCKQQPRLFFAAIAVLSGAGIITGSIIQMLFVNYMVDPVYFVLSLLLIGIFYRFLFTQMMPAKLERSVALWGGIIYWLYSCLVIALVIRAFSLDYDPHAAVIDPHAIQDQARQQITLNRLRPGDIVIMKNGGMRMVVTRDGMRREKLLAYYNCPGAPYTTATYKTITEDQRRIVRRRDRDYSFLAQRFIAAEKCPVVVP